MAENEMKTGACMKYGVFPKLGVPFGGPHNKDYGILGSILGSPYFGKLPYMFIYIYVRVILLYATRCFIAWVTRLSAERRLPRHSQRCLQLRGSKAQGRGGILQRSCSLQIEESGCHPRPIPKPVHPSEAFEIAGGGGSPNLIPSS